MASLSMDKIKEDMEKEVKKMKSEARAIVELAESINTQKQSGDIERDKARASLSEGSDQPAWASFSRALGIYAASKHESLARSIVKEMNIVVQTSDVKIPDAPRKKLIAAAIQIFVDNFEYAPELDHRLRDE